MHSCGQRVLGRRRATMAIRGAGGRMQSRNDSYATAPHAERFKEARAHKRRGCGARDRAHMHGRAPGTGVTCACMHVRAGSGALPGGCGRTPRLMKARHAPDAVAWRRIGLKSASAYIHVTTCMHAHKGGGGGRTKGPSGARRPHHARGMKPMASFTPPPG